MKTKRLSIMRWLIEPCPVFNKRLMVRHYCSQPCLINMTPKCASLPVSPFPGQTVITTQSLHAICNHIGGTGQPVSKTMVMMVRLAGRSAVTRCLLHSSIISFVAKGQTETTPLRQLLLYKLFLSMAYVCRHVRTNAQQAAIKKYLKLFSFWGLVTSCFSSISCLTPSQVLSNIFSCLHRN